MLSFAKSVLSDIDAIDTKYIEPFTTTFLKEYDTVTGAIQTVESLAHQGLQGILAIPQVISGTVSGLENGVIAAAQQTNANQSDLVKGTLAPAISVGIGEPVAKLTGLFGTFAAPGYSTIGLEPPINTEAPAIKDNIRTVLSAHAEALRGQGGFVNDALAGVYDILQFFIAFAGSFEGLLEAARYEGNNDTRPVPLDMGAALEAWRRGILTTANMQTEMAFHGLSDPRISVMSELAKWLPSEVSALRMFLRNIISKDDYNKIQAGHGMTEQDAKAFMDSELEPIDPREAIELNGRMAMRDAKWLAESLGTDIPKEYTALYPPFAKDPNRGVLDWAAHWKIPNIEWWFVAYFRKLVSKQDVTNAAKAENWPTEVIDNMFEVRQELIQEWMIPDILASGVMTDQEALDYMSFAGIEPKSAQILLEWGHTKSRAGGNKQANDLAGLSIGQAQRMYMDGIINQQEFELVLLDHGYSDVAASLTISLANNELDLSSRKAFATLAMKNVLVGNQTLTDMQSMLLGQGYTLKEVQNYVNTVQAQQADKTHAPSTAEAGDMLKKDIITYGEAVSAMRLNGWNDFWLVKWLIYYGGNDIDLATATGPASTLTSTGYFNALAAQTKPASA